jgi:molybdopterin guanine dinucleotide-containing S/N-oxide reductase-like protein
MKQEKPAEEKLTIHRLDQCSHGDGSSPMEVDSKNGRIVRIKALHYNREYDPEDYHPWKIDAHGKTFEPMDRKPAPPYCFAYKKRIYSPNRILYPLMRIDWDPNGNRNTQNRGKSKYKRISWDEALDIITSELKRIQKKYGMYAVLAQSDGHGETKTIHGPHGCQDRLLNLMGGHTKQARNPDSWEGWYWGAKHVWGMDGAFGCQERQTNTVSDFAENGQLLLVWGGDPETTPWGLASDQTCSSILYYYSEIGCEQIYIAPNLNYAAAVHADKWIPIHANTDAALHLAIAYIWMTEGTYDKKYVKTHTFGFDKFQDYVLGKEDGVPKTPKWAEGKCGVPSRIIKALASDWASKRTSTMHGFGGGMIRGPYSSEPARLEVLLLGMQGLGKPGANQICVAALGGFAPSDDAHAHLRDMVKFISPTPRGILVPDVRGVYTGWIPDTSWYPMPKQFIPKTLIPEAILHPPISWYGTTIAYEKTEDQFIKYHYPVDGCSEVHMIWTDTPCWITCWNETNRIVEAYQSPTIEFMLAQHPWMENDCTFADIVLPVAVNLELNDIGADRVGGQYNTVFLEEKAVEPIGEAKSDYEIVCMIADKLGMLNEYTHGKTIPQLIKESYQLSGVRDMVSWETLKKKKYYIVPTDPDWKTRKPGMAPFQEDPKENPVKTPSGKLEFYSQNLAKYFPDDKERPPVPHWIPQGETHQESRDHYRANIYPLLMTTPHPRWRVHANMDELDWIREIPSCKIRGMDGYQYEPVWIHPIDAAKRGIKQNDIVKVFNERGMVLAGAYVNERIMPGNVLMDHGSRYDPLELGKFDRGGAINTITPFNIVSKNAAGMVVNGFLVDVQPVDLDELKKKYPEAFSQPYDQAAGLKFERVLTKGEK